MAEQSTLELQDIVWITDFADNSGKSNPKAAQGCEVGFLDLDTRSQAIVKYHQRTVNRPTEKLVRLVKKSEQVPTEGLLFDNMVTTDREIQQDLQDQDQDGHKDNHKEGGNVQEKVKTAQKK